MKIIINTSNLYVGGGMQVAISFINELRTLNSDNEYHIFLSQNINKQINQNKFSKNFHFYKIKKSPASLKTRRTIVSKLATLENIIKPDIVFSVFAPTYWRPEATHIAGFALGWITNPKSNALKVLSLRQKIKLRLDSIYKIFYIKRDVDYFIVETNDVKEKLFDILNILKSNIFVVSNTYSSYFNDLNYAQFKLPKKDNNEFRMITIAHNYPHKNIRIIKDILPYLENKKMTYKFFITIDNESYEALFEGCEDRVINLGAIPPKYCPSIYQQCDALFLPTLLESFTASYPEAMKMQKPILTSDLSFAHSLCKNAAIYFNPLEAKDIANKIIKLSENKKLQQQLIIKGKEQLKNFETAKSRAIKYLEICAKIMNKGEIH